MAESRPHAGVYAAVAVAAGMGGALRHGVSMLWLNWGGAGWPWPTLIVNLTGSALIAVYWRLAGPDSPRPAALARRSAVMTGFCGGLTTFSAFGVETVVLFERGDLAGALAYVIATFAGVLGAVALVLRGLSGPTPDTR